MNGRYLPEDTLYKQLVFALKYEGINLLVIKKLFEKLTKNEVVQLLQEELTGQYSRKLWFIYERLLNKTLSITDLKMGNYVPLVDDKIQYGIENGEKWSRHLIINNLAGTSNFCPIIRKTDKLDTYINADFSNQKVNLLQNVHKDILQRASAFLLLKDSNASFTIELEFPQ